MVELNNNQLPKEPQESSQENGAVQLPANSVYEEQVNTDYVALFRDTPAEIALRELMMKYFITAGRRENKSSFF